MTCPMCSREMIAADTDILPGKELCCECAQNIRLYASKKSASVKRENAYEYIVKCKAATQDEDVTNAICRLLGIDTKQAGNTANTSVSAPNSAGPAQTDDASDKLFARPGDKIKHLSSFVCWLGIIASMLGGVVMAGTGLNSGKSSLIFTGLVLGAVGSFFSWLASLFAYGYGEIISQSQEQTQLLRELLNKDAH